VVGRHSKEQPRRIDRLPEGQYLALVLAIVLGILVLLAGAGYGIYLLTTLGILLGTGISSGLVLVAFVWSLAERGGWKSWRVWFLPLILLQSAALFMRTLDREHHWPAAQQHTISLAADVIYWVITPIGLAIAAFLAIPPDRRRWPWRRGGPGAPVASPPEQS
jgi:hypothetical protein